MKNTRAERIFWLKQARSDLQAIQKYLALYASDQVAHSVIQRIVHSAFLLAQNPSLGHRSESTDGIHELQETRLPYLLPYRVIAARMEILQVFHQSQEQHER